MPSPRPLPPQKRARTDDAGEPPKKRGSSSCDPVLISAEEPLRLSSFRQHLIRQEETIIFALIERAQFPRNPRVYRPDATGQTSLGKLCLLDHMLRETEMVHARVRRYTSPDEVAFFPEAATVSPILPLLDYPRTIRPNAINYSDKIKSLYLEQVLPAITSEGEDHRTLGSSSVADIAALQALSKRIHYGKFIAEAKFQADPNTYTELIRRNDADGLMRLLTNLKVEESVLDRVELKASTFGQDPASGSTPEYKVDPKVIRATYRDIVMPITKEVQVDYLLQRLEHTQVVCPGPPGSAAHRAAMKHFPGTGENLKVLADDRAEPVVAAVLSNQAASGVLVIESRRGASTEVRELLRNSNLRISAEVYVPESPDSKEIVRCVIVSKTGRSRSGRDKSCVCFSVSHKSGALFEALRVFGDNGVNLTSLESIPSNQGQSDGGQFKYDFFVELDGHLDDPPVRDALAALEREATYVRKLGSFPASAEK